MKIENWEVDRGGDVFFLDLELTLHFGSPGYVAGPPEMWEPPDNAYVEIEEAIDRHTGKPWPGELTEAEHLKLSDHAWAEIEASYDPG